MRIPSATYRIQFNPNFTFRDAESVIGYLAELGISDLYASPIFRARKGSQHGYDVVDANALNPELGDEDDFGRLREAVREQGLGWIQDLVPNHMAYNHENRILMDVLENGMHSPYFKFFNIEWEHAQDDLRDRVLAPFLGRFYGDALENKEIQLVYGEHGFAVAYYDLLFPLKIETYSEVLDHGIQRLKKKLGREHPDYIKYLGVLYVLKTLPSGDDPEERYHQISFIKGMFWELYNSNQDIQHFVDENIEIFNGEKGNPESFNLLEKLLSRQLFRLSFWKVASEELNYRRFFSINDLISVRVEEEDVFEYMHTLVLRLVSEGVFSGLRIDHIDGLYDPQGYLGRLREKAGDIYIVVEKILDRDEELPNSWSIQGTTGYDFLNVLNGLFLRRRNERRFTGLYERFGGFSGTYRDLVVQKKRLIIGKHMAGDVDNLARLLKSISGHYRHGIDITQYGLRRAIVEVMAQFPVYRTYFQDDELSDTDKEHIRSAVRYAAHSNPGLRYELDFIEKFLLLDSAESVSDEDREKWIHFGRKFQQFTGPLMAKGFEDTVLYIYNRLISQNEVGGDPQNFGTSLSEFHAFNEKRCSARPYSMNATATHDAKRGEDVRARINVLSEIPDEWEACLKRWSKINRRDSNRSGTREIPDRNDEYFLYQTLVGAFPFGKYKSDKFRQRIKEYMIKAVREAKIHTAWLRPDSDYENEFMEFIDVILESGAHSAFLDDFISFQRKVSAYGIYNSLSQALIKLTAPGVPDIYQGTELWDFALVDPDNRKPVDYRKRIRYLNRMKHAERKNRKHLLKDLIRIKEDGKIKLFLLSRTLQCRREMPQVFRDGTYVPLKTDGMWKDHIVAFARNKDSAWSLTIAPRFLTDIIQPDMLPLGEDIWKNTAIILPKTDMNRWTDVFTGETYPAQETIPAGRLLKHFPVALLRSE